MTNDKNSAVLAPCPFCGGEAMVRHYRYKGAGASGMETPEPFIRCEECGAKQPRIPCDESPWGQKNNKKTYAQAESEAIAAWNTRQPTQSDALLEGDTQTILYLLGVRHGREDERAKIVAERQAGYAAGVEAAAKALEADAMKCDCFARDEGECGCGAWDDYKLITFARAVEIVRELKNVPPPEGDGGHRRSDGVD